MRLYKITAADVEAVVAAPSSTDRDVKGNPRLAGPDANGRAIIVIVADDDPGFVITTPASRSRSRPSPAATRSIEVRSKPRPAR